MLPSDSATVIRDEAGIWRCESVAGVAYPHDGHKTMREVEDDSFWFRHRNRCIVETVRRLPPSGPILDIGAGNGFVARALAEAGFAAWAMEPSWAGVTAARRRGIEHVIHGAFHDTGFAANTVPAAALFDVIEHVSDDVGMLRDIRMALRPRGRLYVTVPAHRFLFSNADRDAQHFRRYTANTLNRVLTHAGFHLEFGTYFFAPLIAPIFLFRTIPSWVGLRRDNGESAAMYHRARRIVDALLDREARAIAKGKPRAVGASCLMVARKS
ncbi:MAG: class I SAM-dependent methyltransferase [Stellaceae bacterium]